MDNFEGTVYEGVYQQLANLLDMDATLFAKVWRSEPLATQRAGGHYDTFEQCLEEACRIMGVRCDPDKVPQAVELRMQMTRTILVPRPDAVSTLQALRNMGCRIGLISDCSWEVPKVWPETPMAPLVDTAIFSCTAKLKKPDPRTYTLICGKLGVEAAECLYIGDCGSDELTGARNAGMDGALICVPYEQQIVMCRPEAKRWDGPRISSVSDVLKLVTDGTKGSTR